MLYVGRYVSDFAIFNAKHDKSFEFGLRVGYICKRDPRELWWLSLNRNFSELAEDK